LNQSRTPGSPDTGIAEAPQNADRAVIADLRKPVLVERALDWAEHVLPAVWADRVSRGCLIAAIAFFWLTIALGEPLLLVPVVAACVGLWLRRGRRDAAAAAEFTDPDFL
jgi:hypothetical protein